jgi:hypothetical protein
MISCIATGRLLENGRTRNGGFVGGHAALKAVRFQLSLE